MDHQIAHALETRFDEVSRSELERLRKKTAGLAPEVREAVKAVSLQVVHAIAARVGAALAAPDGPTLAPVVARLFDVAAMGSGERHGGEHR